MFGSTGWFCLVVASGGSLALACNRPSEVSEEASDALPDPATTVAASPAARVPIPGQRAVSQASVPSASASASGRASPQPSAASAPLGPIAPPLDAWMRATANPAFLSGDLSAIAATFDQVAPWAPPGYPHWASIAKDGADAARAGKMEAVKSACRECHRQYEQTYRAQLSMRPLPDTAGH